MNRSRLALLALVALCASGESCPGGTPGNLAPNVPTFTLTLIGTTTLSGSVSPCTDDGRPSGLCTQEAVALVPGTASVVARAPVSGGSFTLPGLAAAVLYDLTVGSSDSEYVIYANRIPITTAGTTGPLVLGVTPTEIIPTTSDVFVNGLSLTNYSQLSVRLIDSTTGQQFPVEIENVKPNRIRVLVPRPSDLAGRRRYFLQLANNRKSHLQADVVHLSASGTYLPSR